ncbi:MAG: sigma-70 family RNA polymerase sigma factor [Caldilineaceae bacterium]
MDELHILVARAQHGDQRAYDRLMHRFYALATGYGYAQLGDWQLAEDVTQEAFLCVHRTLDQLREPAAFPRWFRQIVHGQINRVQRKPRVPTVALAEATELVADEAPPVTLLERQEDHAELLTAIDSLPAAQRTVVILFYIGDYSQAIISAFLDIPVATVKTRLHYARRRLKEHLTAGAVTPQKMRMRGASKAAEEMLTTRVMRLFRAIVEDDFATAQALLAEDATLANAKGLEWSDFWHGEVAAIHLAVIYRCKALIDLLLAHGAAINQRQSSNFSVLHFTVNMALAGVISDAEADDLFAFLVARGAVPDIVVYLWRNDLVAVRALLAADPTAVNAVGVMHATPLCHVTDIDVAQLLLDYGADPFQQLDHPWCKEHCADTPLRWAASRPENPSFFRFLLQSTNTPIDIHLAAALGDVATTVQLLARDPDLLEARTQADHVLLADFTPLHVAARYRQPAIAKRLLEQGADPNATTASVKGMTPLQLAVMYSAGDEDDIRIDVPKLLLAHGADVTIRDQVRRLTALEWAEGSYLADEKGRVEVAKLLREHQSCHQPTYCLPT